MKNQKHVPSFDEFLNEGKQTYKGREVFPDWIVVNELFWIDILRNMLASKPIKII